MFSFNRGRGEVREKHNAVFVLLVGNAEMASLLPGVGLNGDRVVGGRRKKDGKGKESREDRWGWREDYKEKEMRDIGWRRKRTRGRRRNKRKRRKGS